MDIRVSNNLSDLSQAIALDEHVIGSDERVDYIRSVAEQGGLSVAVEQDEVLGFCCLDHSYFFIKPFVSLLIVNPQVRRRGVGASLLSFNCQNYPKALWTSTNQSNIAMRALLSHLGWQRQGKLSGLDEDDPEVFFKK